MKLEQLNILMEDRYKQSEILQRIAYLYLKKMQDLVTSEKLLDYEWMLTHPVNSKNEISEFYVSLTEQELRKQALGEKYSGSSEHYKFYANLVRSNGWALRFHLINHPSGGYGAFYRGKTKYTPVIVINMANRTTNPRNFSHDPQMMNSMIHELQHAWQDATSGGLYQGKSYTLDDKNKYINHDIETDARFNEIVAGSGFRNMIERGQYRDAVEYGLGALNKHEEEYGGLTPENRKKYASRFSTFIKDMEAATANKGGVNIKGKPKDIGVAWANIYYKDNQKDIFYDVTTYGDVDDLNYYAWDAFVLHYGEHIADWSSRKQDIVRGYMEDQLKYLSKFDFELRREIQ